jgi:Pvc16 N-terminal domain/Carboxypeptidase regulatory-like domain
MLPELHTCLQRLLYEQGHITPREVDITFEAPTRERIERLTRPTLSLFLFDVQENTELRQTNWQVTRGNGHAERRQPPRRIDLRYMVSALTTEIEDEHALLWRALVTLLKYPELPRDLLPEALQGIDVPLAAKVTPSDEGRRLLDVWSALGVPPRPAIYYVVTVPVDLELAIQAPLVLTRTARYTRADASGVAPESGTHIGGVVRNHAGAPAAGVTVALDGSAGEGCETDTTGAYRLRDVPPGEVSLRISRPDGSRQVVAIQVPQASYDLVLGEAPAPAAPAPGRRGHRSTNAEP